MNGVKLGTATILQDPGGSGALDVPGRMLCGSAKAQRKRQPKARELMAQLRQMLQVTSKYAMWNPKLAAFNMIFIREKPILWGFHVGFSCSHVISKIPVLLVYLVCTAHGVKFAWLKGTMWIVLRSLLPGDENVIIIYKPQPFR